MPFPVSRRRVLAAAPTLYQPASRGHLNIL